MSEDRHKGDKHMRGPARRPTDARGGRPTGRLSGGRPRAFRPLRWAWLLLLVALLAPAYDLFLPAGYHPAPERRTVVIEHGQSLHEIARELQRVGVIRSQAGFLVLARMMRLDRSVKAGQYSFRLGTTVPALLRALDRGMYGLNLVTIPEGLMVSETAALIEREVGIPATSIDSLARDPKLLDSLQVGAPSLEGWLAPDSYEWLPGTSPEVVLRTMVSRTRERVQHATAGYDSLPLGMNAHEVLTLASIVESESRAKDERPRIARVYLNRLDRGMLLQADPTVGYALGRGPRSRLKFKDLRVDSPYNTYRHEGLPPGPICSPGEAAIDAVMHATLGAHDLYFVARGEGHHLFAPTYEQHLANIAFVRGKKAALEARTHPEVASRAEPDDSGDDNAPSAAPLAANPKRAPGATGKGAPGTSHGVIRAAASTPPPVALVTPPPHGPRADSSQAGERGAGVVHTRAAATHAAETTRHRGAPAFPPAATADGTGPVVLKPAPHDSTRQAATTTDVAARSGARDSTRHALATTSGRRARSAAHDSAHSALAATTGDAAKPAVADTTHRAGAKRARSAARSAVRDSTGRALSTTAGDAPKSAARDTTRKAGGKSAGGAMKSAVRDSTHKASHKTSAGAAKAGGAATSAVRDSTHKAGAKVAAGDAKLGGAATSAVRDSTHKASSKTKRAKAAKPKAAPDSSKAGEGN